MASITQEIYRVVEYQRGSCRCRFLFEGDREKAAEFFEEHRGEYEPSGIYYLGLVSPDLL